MEIKSQRHLIVFALYFLQKNGVSIKREDTTKMKLLACEALKLSGLGLKKKYKDTLFYNGILINFVNNKGVVKKPIIPFSFGYSTKLKATIATKKEAKDIPKKQSFIDKHKRMSYSEKIDELKRLSLVKTKRICGTYARLRKKRNKIPEGAKCIACSGEPHCMHHIIQLQNGGNNAKKNLVPICNDCHARVHEWLIEDLIKAKEEKFIESAWDRFD